MNTRSFGELIRDLRLQRELRAKDVAESLGVSLPYLSQLESDRAMPSEALARRIAGFFRQGEDEFVFMARRGSKRLNAILEQSPKSAATYLSSTAGKGSHADKRGKHMVRLIAQSKEDLALLIGTDRTEPPGRPPQPTPGGLFTLADTFDMIRPSVVAFASKMVNTPAGGRPLFPEIIGTGFVVDSDGIVVTNRHVVDALQHLPPHPLTGARAEVAIVWGQPEAVGDGVALPLLFVDIKAYSAITSFSTTGPFYGEDLPDLGFVQLKVRGIPALLLATEPNVLRQGLEVATAGFPLGTDPLIPYGKVSQITPLLRRGIVSSLLPFPCPNPHGFTLDVMSQGGASGSPVFLTNSPTVVGMVHAGFPGTNVTLALPSRLIRDAVNACTNGQPLDLSDVPTLESLMRRGPRTDELRWDSFCYGETK